MTEQTAELRIEGMDCANCASGIERHLSRLGVPSVSVNFSRSSVSFLHSAQFSLDRVRDEIERLGYHVPVDGHAVAARHTLELKFLFALLFTLPLFAHMFLPFAILHDPWVQFAIATPVFVLGLIHFGTSALRSLRTRYPNMDVLIVIGIVAAFGYSVAGTLLQLGAAYLFYETAATITTIVLFGNLLEKRAIARTTSAIGELTKMQANNARRVKMLEGKEKIEEVSVTTLEIGDQISVNEGDKIPVDGNISAGSAAIDESMISGESVAVEKEVGDPVVGGTIVAKGNIRFIATAVGSGTVLAHMIRLVEDAQRERPSIQRIGDRVGAIFVPVVLSLAIGTFLISYFMIGLSLPSALLHSIAVLVISCPCAVGLATPTAIMAGIGQAARHGVLVKGGKTLEDLAQITSIVFDKTGTLTTGRFKIENFSTYGVDEQEARAAIIALEHRSSHPIARSLVSALAHVSPMPLLRIEERKGLGMIGVDEAGQRYEIGSRMILQGRAGTFPPHDLYLFKDDLLIAGVTICDELKADAIDTLAALRAHGINAILLSGDRKDKCEAVAKALGIGECYYEKSPEEKVGIVRTLNKKQNVAFIGDGINDAPSLAQARVGISLSNGSAAAINSAQVVLLKGELRYLLIAMLVARRTFTVIKQNLFWAFIYNVVAIPLAAIGMLNPMIAAFSMAFSDLVVILNSLRLRLQKLTATLA